MYRELPPPGALRHHVACLWVRTVDDVPPGGGASSVILPDGRTDIMSTGDRLLVAGPDDGPVPFAARRSDPIVGVRFRPGRAAVLGPPLAEIRNLRVPLTDVWGRDADRIAARLAGATIDDRLAVLTDEVARRIRQHPHVDPAVADVVRRLEGGDRPAIKVLAADLGLSERQLRRRAIDALGYGPTTFARIVRFRRALDGVRAGEPLADVAATSGYADQSHLTREVRALAGRSPGALARDAA